VWVRAGKYGDLNNNGVSDAPGEEQPITGEAIDCMLCIFKSVRVLSVYGSAVTVIDTGTNFSVAVAMQADGAVFGLQGHGFTVKGGGFTGVEMRTGSYSKVVSNIVENGIHGSACHGPIYIQDNLVTHSGGDGIVVIAEDNCPSAGPIYVNGNIVTDSSGSGFALASIDIVQFVGNVSSHNQTGVRVITVAPIGEAKGVIAQNAFVDNQDAGIHFAEGGATVTGNTILGNQGPGVRVSVANPRNIVLHQNDIYGNDSASTPANCGVINTSAFPVDAKNNYWGSAAGPGVDPADKAGPGSDCDLGAGVTTVKPFAPTLFPIAP